MMINYIIVLVFLLLLINQLDADVMTFVSKNTLLDSATNTGIGALKYAASSSDYYLGTSQYNFALGSAAKVYNLRAADLLLSNYSVTGVAISETPIYAIGCGMRKSSTDYHMYTSSSSGTVYVAAFPSGSTPTTSNGVTTSSYSTNSYALPIWVPANATLGIGQDTVVIVTGRPMFSFPVDTSVSPPSVGSLTQGDSGGSGFVMNNGKYDGGSYFFSTSSLQYLFVYSVPGFSLIHTNSQAQNILFASVAADGYAYVHGQGKVFVYDLSSTNIDIIATYSVPTTTPSGSGAYDKKQGILFYSILPSDTGPVYILAITTNGQSPVLYQIPNESYTVVASIFNNLYPILPYNQNGVRKLFVTSPAGMIIEMNYTSLCSNDCNGLGSCYQTTCTCNPGAFNSDCSLAITSVDPVPYYSYSGTTVTIRGTGFGATVSITLLSQSCTNIVVSSSTVMTCTILSSVYFFSSTFTPYGTSYPVTMTYSGSSYTYSNLVTFSAPTVTGYTLSPGTLMISGLSFFPSTFTKVLFGSSEQTGCSFDPTYIKCPVLSNTQSFNLQITSTNTPADVYYNQPLVLNPIITSLEPNVFNTSSGSATLYGYYFFSNPTYTTKIYQGGVDVPYSSNSDGSFTFTTVDYITTQQAIAISIIYSGTNITSTTVPFTYTAPTISSYTQKGSPTNQYQITGNNFGTSTSLISFNSTSVSQVISASHQTVVFQLSSTATPFSTLMSVFNQAASQVIDVNPVPVISSLPTLPAVDGSGSVVSGNFLLGTTLVGTKNGNTFSIACSNSGTNNYPGSLTCTFPAGTGYFTVTASSTYKGQTVSSQAYSSNYSPPVISSISPSMYLRGQTTQITIKGSNFGSTNLAVTINSETTSIVSVNSTTIVCTITSNIDPGTVTNPVTVSVSVDSLVVSNNTKLSYLYSCPNDCSGSFGTCNTNNGTCTCTSAHQGNDCSLYTCPNSCSGSFGTCNTNNGTCTCTSAHQGNDCSLYTCPNDCSGSFGTCNTNNGTCTCTSAHQGNDCSLYTCPNSCSGSFGTCNTNNGTCTCTSAHQGNDCSLYTCPNNCSGSFGTCNTNNGTCTCTSGHQGNDCSLYNCLNLDYCSDQGDCNTNNGTCTCHTGFEGDDCTLLSCPNNCSGYGDCDHTTGECSCQTGHEGDDCSVFLCLNSCSDQGACNYTNGVCNCNTGFEGPDCSLLSCPKNCSGYGDCDHTTGECSCLNGHEGDDCSIFLCTTTCNLGTCNTENGTCDCDSEHQGPDCSLLRCPSDCSNQGTCDTATGKCTCNSEYTGDDCSQQTPTLSSTIRHIQNNLLVLSLLILSIITL